VNLFLLISPHVLGMPGYGQGWPEWWLRDG
jgi:hypothetical protein